MFKKLSASILMIMMVVVLVIPTAFGAMGSDNSSYEDSAGNVNIEGESVSNTKFAFAGSNINANSVFDTTTFFAGNAITLNGEYNGDVFAMGNTVTVNGKINGNLYTGANQVIINGEVTRDVFVGCSDLIISKSANINRDFYLAAGNVNIDGILGRNLRAGAGKVSISGTIKGFVETDVEQLTINDQASISGPINNRSANEALVAPGANVPQINWEKISREQNVKEGPTIGAIILGIITKLAFILVIWLLISFMTKDFNENTRIMAKKHVPASLGIGAGLFFLTPLLLILSFVIYAPFGLAMSCGIIAIAIFGMPVAAVVLSKLLTHLFEDKMKPLLSSFVAILIVATVIIILAYIPVVNFIVSLLLSVLGVGFIAYNILFTNKKLKEERDLSIDKKDKILVSEKTAEVIRLDDENSRK